MTQIELKGVQKFFGSNQVIKDLNLKIDDNEFIVLLGQSGCGKTTTLRAIAGLETIDEGDILIDGRPVQHLKASARDIAMVFQSFSLYPHMNVYENIAFPLRATRMGKAEVDRSVREIAKVLRITGLLEKRPSALSGGDMQRVAIGRALVRRPKAMLMDEPIGALDAKLREEMRAEIKRLHIKQGSTTIYVTHDQIEAMSLADRIVIMHEGVLQQVGTPEEVYARPTNTFVARFVGSPVMNIIDARILADRDTARVTVDGAEEGFAFPGELLSRLNGKRQRDGVVSLGVRPEGVEVAHEPAEGFLPVEAHIIEPLGAYDIVDLRVGKEMLRARTRSGFVRAAGDRVFARIDPAQAHFFDPQSGESLGVRLD
jgi:multiple sugar transport system ATP-binding protein